MENPTLKLTTIKYMKFLFIFDFVATIVSNILILIPSHNFLSLGMALKLLRFFRRYYIRGAYKMIAKICARRNPARRKMIGFLITTIFELIFWLHVMTCIWIWFGATDCRVDNWQDVPESERSWIFVAGSDFTLD